MASSTIFCNRCGNPSGSDAQFCQRCGAVFVLSPESGTPGFVYVAPLRYAGFWIRVVAAIIDTLLVIAILFPIRWLVGSAVMATGMDAAVPIHKLFLLRRIVRIAVGVMVTFAYKTYMDSSVYQGTLGKIAMGLKIVDLEGKRLSFAHAVGRFCAKWVSVLTLYVGYIMAGFDEQKRALHDRIAGTFVVYK